jgi:cobalt-zinc-cadmium efflux system outer membrane protein
MRDISPFAAVTYLLPRVGRRFILFGLISSMLLFGASRRANAQAQLAEDIIVITKGLREQETGRTTSHLGNAPGTGQNRFGIAPGSGEARLGERIGGAGMARRDVLAAASAPAGGRAFGAPEAIIAPPPRLSAADLPLYGALEVPRPEEEGPPDGLTLDAAIERLVQANLDLQTKFQEIPKARADILSAGLRGNPLVFASADDVPYGKYSPQRPGENGYGITVIQPVDVNHKRRVRILAAQRAKRVLDAQYQDAVRLEIDNLYTAFVDVLAAREAVRYLEASLTGLNEALIVTKQQLRGEERSGIELDRLTVQRDSALIALDETKASLSNATQILAARLNLPANDQLTVRGRITTPTDSVVPLEELIGMALANRPDLTAYRLGIQRAQADVSLARAEAFPDMFVLYTPFGLRNNTPTGGQDATSWSLGVMASVPLFNRNQGNIRRAEINVSQTSIELAGVQRQIETEVRGAWRDYETSHGAVDRLERNVLPRARSVRDKSFSLFKAGEEGAISYLNAQREYSEVVRQYRDALVRHRRAALKLNTAVALRILP